MIALLPPTRPRTRSGEWRPAPIPQSPVRCRWHRFRWAGEDAFSGASLYACRCGAVRPAP
ncbi:hypothetical protein ACI79D_20205 [Geodermatophilus sp. SYSU D00708]